MFPFSLVNFRHLSFPQGDVLSLCICDTNGKDDIHINDKLVNEGFAEFKQGKHVH